MRSRLLWHFVVFLVQSENCTTMEVVHGARAISWRAKRLRPAYHVVDIDTRALCVGAASCCAGGLFAVFRPQHGSATFWGNAMSVLPERTLRMCVIVFLWVCAVVRGVSFFGCPCIPGGASISQDIFKILNKKTLNILEHVRTGQFLKHECVRGFGAVIRNGCHRAVRWDNHYFCSFATVQKVPP